MMKTILSVIGGLLGLVILGIAGFFVYFLVILPRDLPVPDLTVEVVWTRSATYSTRYSSSMMPPSEVTLWLRLNPLAIS